MAAARAAELEHGGRLRSTAGTSRPTRGTTPRARPSSRRSTTSWAGPPSSTEPRCIACARRISGSSSIPTGSPPRGRSATTTWSRTTRWPKATIRFAAPGARTRPSRPRARPTPSRHSRTSPGSSNCPTISPPPASTRSMRRAACCGTRTPRRRASASAAAICDGFPCPLHAKADAEVMGVRPALESPNVTLLTDAPAVRLNTNPEGTVRDRGRDRTRRLDRDRDRRRRRRLVRRGELGQAAAGVGERQASERPGQRLGSGRTQLHVPLQPGGAGPVEGAEPHRLPEDPRRERLLLRGRRVRLPDGEHPDGRQVAGRDVQGREADRDQARADVRAQGHRHARRRLLALDRGPAAARRTA